LRQLFLGTDGFGPDDRDDDGAASLGGGDGAVGSTHAWNMGAAEGRRLRCVRYLFRRLVLSTKPLPYFSAASQYGSRL